VSPAMTANMNAYIDLIMIQVGPWISRSGLIPMPLPDFIEAIEHRPILITYHGELHLTNGELTRLVSVTRSGNALMTYERNMLRIQIAASIRQISVSNLQLKNRALNRLVRYRRRHCSFRANDKIVIDVVFK